MSPRQQDSAPSPREKAIEAYDSARGRVTTGIEQAPLLALAGGLAVGALLAALIPASRRERDLIKPVADRIKDRANLAASAAREAGEQRLGELGLTREKGSETIRSIIEGIGDAAKVSADAGVAAVRARD
jgi:hypothetical protein